MKHIGVVSCALWLACARSPTTEPPHRTAPPRANRESIVVPPPRKQSLDVAPFQRITLSSGATAYLSTPANATGPRPIVLGVHGAQDHADWSCSEWRETTGAFPWVVCPQGAPLRDGFAWTSVAQLVELARECADALRALYPAWVDEGPMIYGGWSQGATLASSVIAAMPSAFEGAVLVEVGHTPISPVAVAAQLHQAGVRRFVISCSTTACRTFSAAALAAARTQGIDARSNDVGLRGHWFDAPVFRTLGEKMPWLVEGDARWDGFERAIRARTE